MEQHCHEPQTLNSLMFIESKAFWEDAIKKANKKLKNEKLNVDNNQNSGLFSIDSTVRSWSINEIKK